MLVSLLCTYFITAFVIAVPGLIGTKLDVKNTNFFANYLPNLCYTFGRFRNLWGDDASQIWQYLCFNDLK